MKYWGGGDKLSLFSFHYSHKVSHLQANMGLPVRFASESGWVSLISQLYTIYMRIYIARFGWGYPLLLFSEIKFVQAGVGSSHLKRHSKILYVSK